VIAGEKAARTPRFVTVKNGSRSLDEASLARARRVVGLKGYVTNIPATVMPAGEVIASYHELWHVEASFRMSKSDLRARPIFHHTRDAIEAHLTIVFAALAVARYLQDTTGMSIKKIVNTLRPLQQITSSHRRPRTPRPRPAHPRRGNDPRRPRPQRSVTHPGGTSRDWLPHQLHPGGVDRATTSTCDSERSTDRAACAFAAAMFAIWWAVAHVSIRPPPR
jgi:hypothetical protein